MEHHGIIFWLMSVMFLASSASIGRSSNLHHSRLQDLTSISRWHVDDQNADDHTSRIHSKTISESQSMERLQVYDHGHFPVGHNMDTAAEQDVISSTPDSHVINMSPSRHTIRKRGTKKRKLHGKIVRRLGKTSRHQPSRKKGWQKLFKKKKAANFKYNFRDQKSSTGSRWKSNSGGKKTAGISEEGIHTNQEENDRVTGDGFYYQNSLSKGRENLNPRRDITEDESTPYISHENNLSISDAGGYDPTDFNQESAPLGSQTDGVEEWGSLEDEETSDEDVLDEQEIIKRGWSDWIASTDKVGPAEEATNSKDYFSGETGNDFIQESAPLGSQTDGVEEWGSLEDEETSDEDVLDEQKIIERGWSDWIASTDKVGPAEKTTNSKDYFSGETGNERKLNSDEKTANIYGLEKQTNQEENVERMIIDDYDYPNSQNEGWENLNPKKDKTNIAHRNDLTISKVEGDLIDFDKESASQIGITKSAEEWNSLEDEEMNIDDALEEQEIIKRGWRDWIETKGKNGTVNIQSSRTNGQRKGWDKWNFKKDDAAGIKYAPRNSGRKGWRKEESDGGRAGNENSVTSSSNTVTKSWKKWNFKESKNPGIDIVSQNSAMKGWKKWASVNDRVGNENLISNSPNSASKKLNSKEFESTSIQSADIQTDSQKSVGNNWKKWDLRGGRSGNAKLGTSFGNASSKGWKEWNLKNSTSSYASGKTPLQQTSAKRFEKWNLKGNRNTNVDKGSVSPYSQMKGKPEWEE